ncbi:MAG: serine hydrolase domain-containing protein [bacterium]|nr:serine hydrolase domain-containing protein [bacterium]
MPSARTALIRHLERLAGRRVAASRRSRLTPAPPEPVLLVTTPGTTFTHGDQTTPFHAASITKLAIASLIGLLFDDGRLTPATRLAEVLPLGVLDGLFLHRGTDYAGSVTIEHLLTHTSGVNDYFEGRTGLARAALATPERHWTRAELIDYTRRNQSAVGAPGERFRYSDTGYALLGLALEAVTGASYGRLMHERIFAPLGMDSARIHLLTIPGGAPHEASSSPPGTVRPNSLAPVWFGGTEVSQSPVLSLGLSPGDMAATPADLDRFGRALLLGDLLSERTRRWLVRPRSSFRPGIRYGAGVMEINSRAMAPFFGALPRPIGHLGAFGTGLFAVPQYGAVITVNLHSTTQMRATVATLMVALRYIRESLPGTA